MPCSSSQKLCSVGERECVIGQPMIPASRVLPVIFIGRSSCLQQPPLPHESERFYQRQPENGEVVALNPTKQLGAATLEPISTHRREQRLAFGSNISGKEGIAE